MRETFLLFSTFYATWTETELKTHVQKKHTVDKRYYKFDFPNQYRYCTDKMVRNNNEYELFPNSVHEKKLKVNMGGL